MTNEDPAACKNLKSTVLIGEYIEFKNGKTVVCPILIVDADGAIMCLFDASAATQLRPKVGHAHTTPYDPCSHPLF